MRAISSGSLFLLVTALAWSSPACDDASSPGADTTSDTVTTDTLATDTATTDTVATDTVTTDTATTDTATTDTATTDTATTDTATTDTATTDTVATDTATTDTDATETTTGNAAAQIQDALTALGSATEPVMGTFQIDDAIVTYVKPATGTESAGLFLQGSETGPAIFVQLEATGTYVPGDTVSVSATMLENVTGIPTITAETTLGKTGARIDITGWTQDVSAKDLVTSYDEFALERISLDATIASGFTSAGQGHQAALFTSAGNPTTQNGLRLRLPTSLVNASGIVAGCTVQIRTGVLWRFVGTTTQIQPSAYLPEDLTVICPNPRVTAAVAISTTEVVVSFDRAIDPASITNPATQFPLQGLTVSGATVQGKAVTLTTSVQTAGQASSVTVAASVKDLAGHGVDSAHATATFKGFAGFPKIVINELDYDQPDADIGEFIELYNLDDHDNDLGTLSLLLIDGNDIALPPTVVATLELVGTIPAHGYAVIGRMGLVVAGGATILNFENLMNVPVGGAIQNGPRDGVHLVVKGTNIPLDRVMVETPADAPGAFIAVAEGTPFASGENNSAPNMSVARCDNGVDTNDNSKDFKLSDTPTPGAENVCP